MTQIKSYLSIQSIGSQNQYQTPLKRQDNQLNTNPSLAYSQTIGLSDHRKMNTQQTFYRSAQIRHQPVYSNIHSHFRQQQFQNNNSSITLNPVITQQAITELLYSQKLITFMVNELKNQKVFVNTKSKYVDRLIEIRGQLEERVKQGNNRYNKKKQKLRIKLNNQHHKEKQNQRRAASQIRELKNQIILMKRKLSLKKISQEELKHKKTERSRKQSQQKDRKKAKVYVPVYAPYYGMPSLQDQAYYRNTNPQAQQNHYQPQYKFTSSGQPIQHPVPNYHNNYEIQSEFNKYKIKSQLPLNPHGRHHKQENHKQKNLKTEPNQRSPFSAMKNSLTSMKSKPPSKDKSVNIMDIIGQKLMDPTNQAKMVQNNHEKLSMKKQIASNKGKPNSVTQQIKNAINQQIYDLASLNVGGKYPVSNQSFNVVPPQDFNYNPPARHPNEYNHAININVKDATNKIEQKLSYFDNFEQDGNSFGNQVLKENSVLHKVANEQVRSSNPRITADKWSKNEDVEQDFQMISMLQQSNHNKKAENNMQKSREDAIYGQNNKNDNEVKQRRYSDNIKLIQTNNFGDIEFLNLPQNSNSHNNTHNNSEVNLVLDINQSNDTPNKNSISKNQSHKNSFESKYCQKQPIDQSGVCILIEDQQSPHKQHKLSENPSASSSFFNLSSPSSRANRSSIPPLNLQKVNKRPMEKIQQVSSRIEITNGADINAYANQKSVDSRYTQTQRDVPIEYSIETNKQSFIVSKSLKKEQQLGSSPPLKKPPSLTQLQKEDEDDIIGSIRLNTDSRISRDSKKREFYQQFADEAEQIDDEDGIMGQINLTAQSKISRFRNSAQFKQNFTEKELHLPTMTMSEMKQNQLTDMEAEDSQLRQSTRSSITKKGSAIHKSTNRNAQSAKQNKNLEKSTSYMRRSPELTNMPIQQVQEQEQIVSVIHKKNLHQRANSSEKM